jgi:repressor LexA
MANTDALTPRQLEIYEFIREEIDRRGYPPTIRDIGKRFDIQSPNGVMCHLKALEKKGLIIRDGKHARAIRLTDRSGEYRHSRIIGLPYLGVVAAGAPIEAPAQDERMSFDEIFAGDNHFVLKVNGQSMIENHIDDGDYVVIRKQETAENGENVVAKVDGEVTLKRLEKHKDRVVLHPANGTMRPIVLDPERNIEIIGVLVGVLRKC